MASAKELKKKIRSISNTRKITRTMELVATVKSKRTQSRVQATAPYSEALGDLLADLGRAASIRHPLLEALERKLPTVLFVITANRGLCGGYNTNVMARADALVRAERESDRPVEIYMAGKKGIARLRFLKYEAKERFLGLDDKATFAEVEKIAEALMRRFLAGEIGKVLVVSTRYLSASNHQAEVAQLLPIAGGGAQDNGTRNGADRADRGDRKDSAGAVDYIFEPDPGTILQSILPLSVKVFLFRLVVEASASEQAARRLAMKLATDNAEEMISYYSRFYNRTRQAAITQQINEIVSGANAQD